MADEPKPDPSKPDDQKKEEKHDAKDRIEDLVKQREAEKARAEAAEAKVKEYEAAQKKAEEERLAKTGEFEKLAQQREKELEKERKEKETMKSSLDAYEAAAKETIKKSLESVKDEKKRATIQKVLDGKPLTEQSTLLTELLEAIGTSAPSAHGNATPTGDVTPGTAEVEKDEYRKLYDKAKTGKITPAEDLRMKTLAKKLGEIH